MVERANAPVRQACEIRIGSGVFVADAAGALWHEAERTLVVADLHLEKSSSFARRGMLLPPYDTAATLVALAAVIARYDPARVISLGDGFHDGEAAARLGGGCREALAAMQVRRDWIWVAGNHDPGVPAGLSGEFALSCTVGGVMARHEPSKMGADGGELAGHLHPVVRIVARGGGVRRRCFVSDGRRCILPAFGAYAGGLDLWHRAFAGLFDRSSIQAAVLGTGRIHVFGAHAFAR